MQNFVEKVRKSNQEGENASKKPGTVSKKVKNVDSILMILDDVF